MRTEVTAEKLRGGYYTPPGLVRTCLDRVRERLPGGAVRVLEPSAGDGAFLRPFAHPDWRPWIGSIVAVEPLEIEAEKCRRALADGRLQGDIVAKSAIQWAVTSTGVFDAAVGNPPFVRYQFISASDRAAILDLGQRLGIKFAGVSNLWIPVLLAGLSRLRLGGVFAFVVPSECLTGCSASVVRRWLIDECDEVCLDLFPPGSFPEVLQEVVILSGRRSPRSVGTTLPVRVVEHLCDAEHEWSYGVEESTAWTRYLLEPKHLEALEAAQSQSLAARLGDLVAFEVSIVTGANDFFSVDDERLAAFGLEKWARPLLSRSRHAPGLVFTENDHKLARAAGAKVWLLDFAAEKPDPRASALPSEYLRQGEDDELHRRYKCRIREPWYRVPGIVRGTLLLSKRCHLWPRVVVNEAESFTTDTIYRGRMVTTDRTDRDVAAAFHNSLTLLTAELEGRSFGGGVLELVPSEIARLTTLVPMGAASMLPELDCLARSSGAEALVERTDEYLVATGALPRDLLPCLREARLLLAGRRLDRNRRAGEDPAVAEALTAAAAA